MLEYFFFGGDDIDVDIYGWKTYGTHILTVGYIPELKSPLSEDIIWGKMMLKGTNTEKDTFYQLNGVQHTWNWDIHYQIIIHSDGRAAYYDFTDVPVGESTTPKEYYDCKAPKTASIRIASK